MSLSLIWYINDRHVPGNNTNNAGMGIGRNLVVGMDSAQCVQSACFVAGDFCQYWNSNSQISNDFYILIVVSEAKFKKKLNGQTRFT